ncbi:hypothetical protein ExPUPEC79_01897 [Escherichia coli]|nr:hypothetical protein ExPUPEC79_01897 [Escherichia coli]
MVDCIGKCLAIARKPRINQRKSAAGFYGELINIIQPARPGTPLQSGVEQRQHQQTKPKNRDGISQ